MRKVSYGKGAKMNDFTKEELIVLLAAFQSQGFLSGFAHNIMLEKKLKAMIDNYCEHKDTCRNCDCTTECIVCGKIWS